MNLQIRNWNENGQRLVSPKQPILNCTYQQRSQIFHFKLVSVLVKGLGSVYQKLRKLFGPVKPFWVHLCLYLETDKCITLKRLVWREPLFILRIIMWIKQLCNHKFRDFASTFRLRKLFGIEKHEEFQTLVQTFSYVSYLNRALWDAF